MHQRIDIGVAQRPHIQLLPPRDADETRQLKVQQRNMEEELPDIEKQPERLLIEAENPREHEPSAYDDGHQNSYRPAQCD
jgi:hypothetical protein